MEIGAEFLHAINTTARTECGFATVDSVLRDVFLDLNTEVSESMTLFFLSVLKYIFRY